MFSVEGKTQYEFDSFIANSMWKNIIEKMNGKATSIKLKKTEEQDKS